ncbi:MAG: hypothetical protein C0623_13690 [Desulfuromonas sp.]|nr:MAG: hypothetical protein C0623_13690 [Desulfuromonas sp.]
MTTELNCQNPEEHHQHLCVLKTKLSRSELKKLTRHPHYKCEICKGMANHGRNLCVPKKIRS